MGADFLRVVSIGARRTRSLGVAPATRCLAGERTTFRTESPAEEATTNHRQAA